MTQQFTASEVRDLAKRGTDAMQQFIDGRHTLHIPPQHDDADMVIAECLRAMDAFADLLEAREKAVPVAWWNKRTGQILRPHELDAIPDAPHPHSYFKNGFVPLTAHSVQAQPPAARVPDAETLRLHLGELTPDEVCVAKAAYALALAAHSAKAQPPAASVTDAMVERALSAYYVRDIDSAGFAWEDAVGDPRIAESDMRAALEAALAAHYAQAQPQASSLPFSRAQFRQALMDAGVVKREAIDDSVNYDGGLTRDNVGSSYCALHLLAAQENPNG